MGVVGSEGGFGDGEGAFGEGPGLVGLAQVPQDDGEVVQVSGDLGVAGSASARASLNWACTAR